MVLFQRLFRTVFLIAFGIALFFMIFQNGIFMALAAIAAASYWGFKKNLKHFCIVLFALSFLSRLAVVLLVNTPISSDFSLMFNSSHSWANGDMSFLRNAYYNLWPYQLPFTAWQALLLYIFDSALFIRIINCFLMAGSNLLIYCIAREISTERSARLCSLLYLVFLFPLSLAPVLTKPAYRSIFCNSRHLDLYGGKVRKIRALPLCPDRAFARFWQFDASGGCDLFSRTILLYSFIFFFAL